MGVHKRERELEEIKEHYIKKTSCILFVLMALLGGLFLGNQITVIYMGRQAAVPQASVQQQPQQAAPTADPNTLARLESEASGNPTDSAAWVRLGNFCFDNGLPGKAVAAYERALELKPMQVGVWSDLGVMYRRTGQFQKALEAFQQAAAMDSTHEVARFNMGIVYLHDLQDPVNARKAWQSVLDINPNAKAPNGQPVADLVKGLVN